MKNFATAMGRVLRPVSTAALWFSGVCLIALTLVMAWQVFGRFVLNDSPSWSEALALLLMGWFVLVGSAVGIRNRDHLGFSFLQDAAPAPVRASMQLANFVLMAGFGAMMAWYGATLVYATWSGKMPGIALPQGVDYIPLVLGGVLVFVFSLEKFFEVLAGRTDVTVLATET
jgi:TRAP-type C4-dicarboxylate transport system permease small subunit